MATYENVAAPELSPRHQVPSALWAGEIEFTRALDLLGIEFTSGRDDGCRSPGSLGRADQNEIRDQVLVHDTHGDFLGLDGAASRERALEIFGTAIHSDRLAVPQQSQPERTHNRPSAIFVSKTATGSYAGGVSA